jgi:hypothetical protein
MMTTTSTLHIASSLLLLPYGLVCVCGIKAKLDQDDDSKRNKLGAEEQGTLVAWLDRSIDRILVVLCSPLTLLDLHALQHRVMITVHAKSKRLILLSHYLCNVPLGSDRKPRGFLLGIDRVVSELVGGGHSFPWYHFEVFGLIAGAVGALGSWLPSRGFYFYVCNYLLAMSAMFFFIMLPYFLDSLENKQHRQSAPILAAVIGINAIAIVIRVGILEAPYDTKHYADPFHLYIICLFAYCVFANVFLSCKKRNARTHQSETDNSEEFIAVDEYSVVTTKAGDVLGGSREPLFRSCQYK